MSLIFYRQQYLINARLFNKQFIAHLGLATTDRLPTFKSPDKYDMKNKVNEIINQFIWGVVNAIACPNHQAS
jgi:hypothetical protein